jgi:nucleotide-binding universal stress UspA family protein
MAPKTVVVGVDDSPQSLRAAELGVQLAQAAETGCRLIHALPRMRQMGLGGKVPLQQARAEARQRLAIALRDAVPGDLLEQLHVGVGRPATLLANEVERDRGWVVVVGGKHHAALVRAAGRSTAHELIRAVSIPVLVTGPSGRPVERVLAAVDLSAAAGPTLVTAMRFAQLLGAKLLVLHVIEPIKYPMVVPLTKDDAAFARASEARFRRLLTRRGLPSTPEGVVRRGAAEDCIATEAIEWGADLLVVGSHGKSRADRLFLGSVTEALLNRLPTAMLVVRRAVRSTTRGRRVARYVL